MPEESDLKQKTNYLKEYRPCDYCIDHVDLTFDIGDEHTRVTAVLKIHKNADTPGSINNAKAEGLILDKGKYQIRSVVADTMLLLPQEYEITDDTFKLNSTPENFELEIVSVLKPSENTTLEGLYQSGDILCTQCEAEGFRQITPFLDRPDVMATYSCTIIADKNKYPVLLSNGNRVKSGDLEGNRHYARWEDPFKKPSYLFALVAGDLAHISDQFITKSGRTVDLKIYSEKENISKCDHAMESLKQAMKWDEDRFKLEYDLDLYQIVAINDFNAGAMENKGLNIFNSKYVLADYQSATDEDFMNIQGVIGHEYFHNWTGNRVTLKNWFQLSLKEGLTVFRDQEFSSDLNSRGVKRISCVRILRAFQFPEDSGPMTHAVRPDAYIKMDNFYTMTVYEKGSELIRMIHLLLGEELFQKGIQIYFEKYDGMAVTVEDFICVMEKASKKDLQQFMIWYLQSGTPVVTIKTAYDDSARTLRIELSQNTAPDRNQEVKQPLHIPVRIGILDKEGREITPKSQQLLEMTEKNQSFDFTQMPEGCRPSIFRGFSAPVKTDTDFSDADLAFFMAHDTDEFNRWDAAQSLLLSEIKKLVSACQENRPLEVSPMLTDAFEKALINPDTDRAFLSKILALPSETEIKDQYERIDVQAIHDARSFLETTIGSRLKSIFSDTLAACSSADPKSLSHEAMADRSLKNICLAYLGSIKDKEAIDLVEYHFNRAATMTEEMAAFKILADMSPEIKKQAVDQFYNKWKKDPLVLDKWFSVQAASMTADTFENVQALCSHSDFSMTNPNKVRALIYMFALYNPIHFHRKDGLAYQFIADRIIELDTINPMVAARLSGCFNHWKRYDTDRKMKMKTELERIMAVKSLSRNVYEIVSRALEVK